MARNFYVGQRIYDCNTYCMGKVTEINNTDPIECKLKLTDENYNTWWVKAQDAYVVNEELSQKHNIIICDEHDDELDYPYYIPIADENAYEIELEHFAETYS